MKTAEWFIVNKSGVRENYQSEQWNQIVIAMKEYAQEVAKKALKDASEAIYKNSWKTNSEIILNTPIITP